MNEYQIENAVKGIVFFTRNHELFIKAIKSEYGDFSTAVLSKALEISSETDGTEFKRIADACLKEDEDSKIKIFGNAAVNCIKKNKENTLRGNKETLKKIIDACPEDERETIVAYAIENCISMHNNETAAKKIIDAFSNDVELKKNVLAAIIANYALMGNTKLLDKTTNFCFNDGDDTLKKEVFDLATGVCKKIGNHLFTPALFFLANTFTNDCLDEKDNQVKTIDRKRKNIFKNSTLNKKEKVSSF